MTCVFTRAEQPAAASPAVRDALAGFARWDADGDGALDGAEMDRAIASPDTRGGEAAAAVALRRIARRATPGEDKRFTRDSILGLSALPRIDSAANDEGNPEADAPDSRADIDRYHAAAMRKINQSPRGLFVGEPRLAGFRQGRLGTCFSLAPLAALMNADPERAARIFHAAPDGSSFTVVFGLGYSVTVTPLTDGEIALGADTGGNGFWAALYEKAVGELRRGASDAPPHAIATRGGSAGAMVVALTGRSIRRFSCKPWLPGSKFDDQERAEKLNELRELLRAGAAGKKLMTAGTSGKTLKVPSLSRNHAYAVLGYDAATDLVTFRDPHGQDFEPAGQAGLKHGYPVARGIFRVPASDAVRIMSGFAFETDELAPAPGYPKSADASPASS